MPCAIMQNVCVYVCACAHVHMHFHAYVCFMVWERNGYSHKKGNWQK